LGFVGQFPLDEGQGQIGVFAALRDGDDVAADEGRRLAVLDARQKGDAEIEIGRVLL